MSTSQITTQLMTEPLERITELEFTKVGGKDWHKSKKLRAANVGILNRNRTRRVLLESVKVAGSICSSKQAVARFIAALNADEPEQPQTTNNAEAAHQELAEALA